MTETIRGGLVDPATRVDDRARPLGCYTHGWGPERVLVLHDWMGDAANYEPLLPYLDAHAFSYVFADARGYGRSRHAEGAFSAAEMGADVIRLADYLGWKRFHLVGHSMTGMVVQRMMLDDALVGTRRIKSVVAITPVSAGGYPADAETRQFLWNLIHEQALSEQGYGLLTGGRLPVLWARRRTARNLQSSTPAAMKGYYRMWLETDFSEEVRRTKIGTPILVIGGRQDLPGFQEEHLRKTFGTWYPAVEFAFITDAGHYPMFETPVYLAGLIERFLTAHT